MNNLDIMKKRLEWQGGVHQEDRMIKGKWLTLQRVLKYSYQACTVQKVQPFDQVLPYDWKGPEIDESHYPYDRALINPDKVKQDYDDKIISIDYESNYGPGDIFEWKGRNSKYTTGSHWIIYTQELTEDAYFRGEIRRCRYMINFKDEEGKWCSTFAAIRGPVETEIDSIQKNQERIDRPNLTLNILIPQNEKTLYAFDRYAEFLFAGRCWRVNAPDSISMKNIIEINAEEDYINKHTDDIEQEMKNGLVIAPVDPNSNSNSEIVGPTFIKPKIQETYSVGELGGEWRVLENVPVHICIASKYIKLTWEKTTSGQFTLQWSKEGKTREKTIVVESLY